ncbi:MAG: serine--tRNA ligase [candidate division Zixibacteria bacterium]|nr:serine--tRNA ligase [candidate division Zixibacteria bacterium]NIT54205.1 serine--tRNA ligase [candidate division Zixibacteria bacterium]NIW42720.1 serine--tRNA ligase [candidate division Zixibacteria bacterium]NIX59817.1 serine--tRNA ligase [candidate division Zixibacteria bacterium]
MLDLRFISENAELVKKAIKDKHENADIDKILELDSQRKDLIQDVESKKAQRNKATSEIAKLKKSGQDATALIGEMKKLGQEIAELDDRRRDVENELKELLLTIPNIPDPDTPVGNSEDDNVEIRSWGDKPKFDFTPAPHWELGEKLRLFDLPSGAKISGSGFILYTGRGARLQRALINFMLDLHISEHNYKEVSPPFMVTRQTMTGTGQLPKLEEDMYELENRQMFLIPTAEVPVTNIHADEILNEDDLPIYYAAYTPCFRREAGAHGKDTRGLIRIHQFDKVELVKVVKQENSKDELEALVSQAEKVLQLLNLPYRVRILCTADLSFAAAKCYDIEVYSAGVDKFLEVSSCSVYNDFQARRMNLRYRPKDGKKPLFCHTLNGSGLALPRTVIAILENYQTGRGTVIVPEVLRPYMGGIEELD